MGDIDVEELQSDMGSIEQKPDQAEEINEGQVVNNTPLSNREEEQADIM